MDKKNLKNIYGSSWWDSRGSFGYEINIFGASMTHELSEAISFDKDLYAASKLIEQAIVRHSIRLGNGPAETKKNREQIIGLFDSPIHVKEIPNGYDSSACSEHLPWFIVTTKIGPIKIGWRNSVILIDWSESDNKKYAESLFPYEDVTKLDKGIHAHSLEKAREYLGRIIG